MATADSSPRSRRRARPNSMASRVWFTRARILLACLLVLFAVRPAPAQIFFPGGDPRFSSGPLSWTPALSLGEAGLDSNVFRSATHPKEDWFATVQPQVDARLTLGAAEIQAQGSGELVHFQRYTSERALNGRLFSRAQLNFTRVRPFAGVNVSVVKDRPNSEIDVRARRYQRGVTAGLVTQLTSRGALELGGARQTYLFYPEATYRGVDLAPRLNLVTTAANALLRFDMTPLTAVIVDADAARDEFTRRPGGTERFGANVGVRFAPDAIIRGRATVGYQRIVPYRTDEEFGYSGWQAAVDLSYTMFGRTRVDVRTSRSTNYSSLEDRLYFVSTGGGIDILQTLAGPVDLVLRGSIEELAYAPTSLLPSRTDRYDLVGGGLSVRVGSTMRVGLNYSLDRRLTPLAIEAFERRRIYTSIRYGF